MKDEIKEILEFLNIPMNESWACSLEDYQAHLLLDYITNLQEKYNEYKNLYFSEHKVKEDYKSRNEKAIEKIKKIQENAIKYGADHDASICQDLINILQGEDKDD